MTTCLDHLKEVTNNVALLSSQDQGKHPNNRNDDWKFKPPAEGESTSKVVNGKTFYFCTIEHNNGKGMWTLHKEEDHDSSKYRGRKGRRPTGSNYQENAGSKLKLKESFAAAVSVLQDHLNK